MKWQKLAAVAGLTALLVAPVLSMPEIVGQPTSAPQVVAMAPESPATQVITQVITIAVPIALPAHADWIINGQVQMIPWQYTLDEALCHYNISWCN